VCWYGNANPTFTTGLIAPAIAIYGARVGADVVATTSGALAGMTWGQIAQGITNALAASQNARRGGNKDGGWGSSIPGNGDSDSSSTRWAVISLLYNETLGAVTPETVKSELRIWLEKAQSASGAACDKPGAEPCGSAETGGWLLAMKYAGSGLGDPKVRAAIDFLNTHWKAAPNDVPRGSFGDPNAMLAVYMGLEANLGRYDTSHITNVRTDCGATANGLPGDPSGSIPCSWSEDYNQWLVENQKADGSWGGYSYWTDPLAAAFYVNILGATQIPVATYKCPLGQDVWKNTPNAWAAASLRLGGQTYTKEHLLGVLGTSIASGAPADASQTLAEELTAAKLNIAWGSYQLPIAGVIMHADRLLDGFDGRLPYYVAPSSLAGQKMTGYAAELRAYNSGSRTRGCITAGRLPVTSTPELTRPTARVQDTTALSASARTSSAVPLVATAQEVQPAVNLAKLRPRVRRGVTSVSVNPDGTALAGASTDNRIRLWSAVTGQQLLVLAGSRGLPTGLAFGGGGRLISVARDSVVRVWDVPSGTELAALDGHAHAITAVAASPDGKFLASAGEESRILLWDAASRKLSRILFGPTNFVNALTFSPDSRLLASGAEDARVLLFDIVAGKHLYSLRGHSGPIDAVAFSPDGTLLASAGQDTVIHLWNPVNGRQLRVLRGHSAPIRTISFSPDGQVMASAGEDTRIMLWNTVTGAVDKILSGSTGVINSLAFAPRAPLLASASEAGDITIWNVITGAKQRTIIVPTRP
jgi:WD40 repeat protein